MKKILIAVTLLGLSSTAFADNNSQAVSACNDFKSAVNSGKIDTGNLNGFETNMTKYLTSNGAQDTVAQSILTNYYVGNYSAVAEQCNSSFASAIDTTKIPVGSNTGVSSSDFKKDQERQDAALKTETEERKSADKALDDKKVDKTTQDARDQGQDDHINAVQGAAQSANEKADAGAVRADNIETSLANTDKRSINNAVRLDGVESKNDDQDKVISGKADQSALDKEVSDRTKGDAALSDTINQNKNDQAVIDNGQNVRMDGIETQAGVLDTRVGKTEVRLDNAEGAIRETNEQLSVTDKRSQNNAVRLDGVETKNTEQDKLISQKVDTTTFKDDQERQDKVIATKASKKELARETASRKNADTALSSRIDSNDATLVQHDKRITSNTQRIGSVEGRVSNLEQSTNKRFADVDKRIGDNRKVASAGIAGAGAMANIPGLTQNGNFSVGAGVGGYDGEQAVAVGFNARISQNVTTKVTVSTNTQSEVLWGAGVGVEW